MPETYQIPAALPEWDGGPWLTEADLRAIIEDEHLAPMRGAINGLILSAILWVILIAGFRAIAGWL